MQISAKSINQSIKKYNFVSIINFFLKQKWNSFSNYKTWILLNSEQIKDTHTHPHTHTKKKNKKKH